MRIGIFGGSFNPIHTGHISLGKTLCKGQRLDELWFMVSPLNPFKQTEQNLLPDEARFSMVSLAVEGIPNLRASDFEMQLPRPSYMVYTLEQLRARFPQHEFTLVIGADNWLRFPQWKDSSEILRHHDIIVYPRPGYPIDASALPPGVRVANTPLLNISSTDIRQAIAQGNYHGRGLPHAVWHEICKNKYYHKTDKPK